MADSPTSSNPTGTSPCAPRLEHVLAATGGFLLQVETPRGAPGRLLHSLNTEAATGRGAELERNPEAWMDLLHADDRNAVDSAIRRTLRGEEQPPLDVRLLHADGQLHWVRMRVRPAAESPAPAAYCDLLFLDYTSARLALEGHEKSIANLSELVTLDALTNLFNRRGVTDALRRAWNISLRQRNHTGLLLIDLDYFKTINDTLGHAVGDEVLREAATLIREVLREEDAVGRLGGDEIVVILPLSGPEETCAAGERLLMAFRKHRFLEATHRLAIRISIGAACRLARDNEDPEQLLGEADRALYRAKHGGRDRLCLGDTPEPHSGVEIHLPAPISDHEEPRLGRILILDDDETVLKLTGTMLTRLGYHALITSNSEKAFEMVQAEKGWIDVALIDLNLERENSGLDAVSRIGELDDTLVGIIITGDATLPAAIGALRHGAYDFLQKPFSIDHLRLLLDRAMKYRNLLRQRLHYRLHMEEMARRRSEALSKLTGQLEHAYQATLETLATVIDTREHQTGAHSGRVSIIAGILARALALPGEDVDNLMEGARLHDIGKVGVPDAVLLKPGSLTPEEWSVIRKHPETGYRMLKDNPLLAKVAEIVYQHQERYDGSGYPQGLRGDQICPGARLFAVADSYDAIRSNRPYSVARNPQVALEEILRGRGVLFDPRAVDALVQTQAEIESACQWPPPSPLKVIPGTLTPQ